MTRAFGRWRFRRPRPPAAADRPGTAAPLTFAIVCIGRVGSEHLVSLLNSHPEIACWGELFNPVESQYARERRGDHHAYLREVAGSLTARAVGCKLTWPTLHSYPMLLDLFHDPRLRIVRLIRSNYLAMHVSVCHARATGVMHTAGDDTAETTVRIDPEECLNELFSFYVLDHLLDELTRHNPVLRLEYTDLSDEAALAELQRFLGVEPATLTSPHRKIVRRPLHETIENFAEVTTVLTGTPWEPFLAGEG